MFRSAKGRWRWMLRMLPVALILATGVGLALPSLASAGGLSSLLELGSELVDGVGSKVPDSFIAPSEATSDFLPSSAVESAVDGDPTLSAAAGNAKDSVGTTADQFGSNVADVTAASEGDIAAAVTRDCVKSALNETAWDVWWSSYYHETFDVSQTLVNATADCLHTYTEASWTNDEALAHTLTYYLDQSAGTVVRYQADAATLSNWLEAVSQTIPS
jgi:hypothetical protein